MFLYAFGYALIRFHMLSYACIRLYTLSYAFIRFQTLSICFNMLLLCFYMLFEAVKSYCVTRRRTTTREAASLSNRLLPAEAGKNVFETIPFGSSGGVGGGIGGGVSGGSSSNNGQLIPGSSTSGGSGTFPGGNIPGSIWSP